MTDERQTDNALATIPKAGGDGAIARVLEPAATLGAWMAKSKMFGCNTIEQGQVLAVTCLTEGITPIEFNKTYYIMDDGTLQDRADAMLGKFVQLGGDYDVIEATSEKTTIKFTWRGKETEFSYSVEEARQAGLVKDKSAWKSHPRNKCFWACVRNYLRLYVPEHFAGYDLEVEGRSIRSTPHAVVSDTAPDTSPLTGEPVTEAGSATTITVDAAEEPPPVVAPAEPSAPEPAAEPSRKKVLKDAGIDPDEAVTFLRNMHPEPWLAANEGVDDLPDDRWQMLADNIDAFRARIDKGVS